VPRPECQKSWLYIQSYFGHGEEIPEAVNDADLREGGEHGHVGEGAGGEGGDDHKESHEEAITGSNTKDLSIISPFQLCDLTDIMGNIDLFSFNFSPIVHVDDFDCAVSSHCHLIKGP